MGRASEDYGVEDDLDVGAEVLNAPNEGKPGKKKKKKGNSPLDDMQAIADASNGALCAEDAHQDRPFLRPVERRARRPQREGRRSIPPLQGARRRPGADRYSEVGRRRNAATGCPFTVNLVFSPRSDPAALECYAALMGKSKESVFSSRVAIDYR